jgi:hypothetical protein
LMDLGLPFFLDQHLRSKRDSSVRTPLCARMAPIWRRSGRCRESQHRSVRPLAWGKLTPSVSSSAKPILVFICPDIEDEGNLVPATLFTRRLSVTSCHKQQPLEMVATATFAKIPQPLPISSPLARPAQWAQPRSGPSAGDRWSDSTPSPPLCDAPRSESSSV